MLKIFITAIILFSISGNAQTKYYIFFKDKGVKSGQTLNKAGALYKAAVNSLSPRSIERRKKVMGDNYITYEDLPLDDNYISQIKTAGIKIENKLKWFNAVTAYLTKEEYRKADALSFVDIIKPVRILPVNKPILNLTNRNAVNGNTVLNGLDYGASIIQDKLVDIPQAQEKGFTGKGVIIGLLDSGFRWRTTQALENADVIAEYDFVMHDSITANEPGDYMFQDSHGTFVFSEIAGYAPGNLIGPAFGAEYILAKTENVPSESHIEEDNYAAALEWMESLGVDITSSSLAYSVFDDSTYSYTYKDMNGKTTIVTRAAELAFKRGVLTITAAGNQGDKKWHYIEAPADGFNTIAVGAVNSKNVVASFSGRGPTYDGRIKPDVVAMGVSNVGASTSGYNVYTQESGTSMAAPMASGVAALLKSAYPHLTNVQMRSILLETADNSSDPNNDRGYGLVSSVKSISFPNIEADDGINTINKMFLDYDSIKVGSVKLFYSEDKGNNYQEADMQYDGKVKYSYTLPSIPKDRIINFYFKFEDANGRIIREPAKYDNYKFVNGGLVVGLHLDVPVEPTDYVLSPNYPNPFNNSTTINFIAAAKQHARLVILNAIGEVVKVLFDGDASVGMNSVNWDGRTDRGFKAASGVYYYILKLGDKEYGNKMMLLK